MGNVSLDLSKVEPGNEISQIKQFAPAASENVLLVFYFCPNCNYALCSNYALSLLMTTKYLPQNFLQPLIPRFVSSLLLNLQICDLNHFSVKTTQYACRSLALSSHRHAVRPHFETLCSQRRRQTISCKFPEPAEMLPLFLFCRFSVFCPSLSRLFFTVLSKPV